MPKNIRSGRGGNDLPSIVQQVLIEDVAPIVEEILKKHIQSDIYDVYTPQEGMWVNGETYDRRHVLEDNIISEMISPDTLLVTSSAGASHAIVKGWEFSNKYPGAFLEMLENGNMGIWKSGFARPAVANAQAEVDDSSAVRQALESGIREGIRRATQMNT